MICVHVVPSPSERHLKCVRPHHVEAVRFWASPRSARVSQLHLHFDVLDGPRLLRVAAFLALLALCYPTLLAGPDGCVTLLCFLPADATRWDNGKWRSTQRHEDTQTTSQTCGHGRNAQEHHKEHLPCIRKDEAQHDREEDQHSDGGIHLGHVEQVLKMPLLGLTHYTNKHLHHTNSGRSCGRCTVTYVRRTGRLNDQFWPHLRTKCVCEREGVGECTGS